MPSLLLLALGLYTAGPPRQPAPLTPPLALAPGFRIVPLCSQGAQLLKWPREQMDKWGPWFLFWLFFGKGWRLPMDGAAKSNRGCMFLRAARIMLWPGLWLLPSLLAGRP